VHVNGDGFLNTERI